jgi:hypothetical protein
LVPVDLKHRIFVVLGIVVVAFTIPRTPLHWRAASTCIHALSILSVRHLGAVDPKGFHAYFVLGSFIFIRGTIILCAAHPELAGGHIDHHRAVLFADAGGL